LWSLALLYHLSPSPDLQAGLEKGIRFFEKNSSMTPEGFRVLSYRKARVFSTGTAALISLSLIDYLRSAPALDPDRRMDLETLLDGYLAFILEMQLPSGHFASGYHLAQHSRTDKVSPYFDGESLLCLVMAARHLHRDGLRIPIQQASSAFVKDYTEPLLAGDGDSKEVTQFYQWGSMAFWEMQDAGMGDAEALRDATLLLANWQLYDRRITAHTGNYGHAIEGLFPAYATAQARKDKAATRQLKAALGHLISHMLTYQIGGPLGTRAAKVTGDEWNPESTGGFLSRPGDSVVRIDVTQHSTHALIMALESLYPPARIRPSSPARP